MRIQRVLALLSISAFLFAITAYAQDSQSLGDAARQARQQKQQKETQAKAAAPKDASNKEGEAVDPAAKDAQSPKTPHVITNEEIGVPLASPVADDDKPQTEPKPANKSDVSSSDGDRNERAAELTSRIQEQKSAVESLQSQITELSESVRYAGANCVANCEQWNERQKQKQDQVESMKTQLEEQKKRLEEMQESARKQGFGSSVYEP